MKFRKTTSVSPKMELLSRRNHATKTKSTFKRSRSFRASVKLMSKIRNTGNLRIAVGQQQQQQPTDSATVKKEATNQIVSTLPESPSSVKILEEATNVVLARRSRGGERSTDVKGEHSRRNASARDEKVNRTRNDEVKVDRVKSKLSFTERIMGMHLRGKEESKKPSCRQATPGERSMTKVSL